MEVVEAKAKDKIGALFGGLFGGVAFNKLGGPELLPMLRGEKQASPWLADALRLVSLGLSNEKLAPVITDFIVKTGAGRNFPPEKIVNLVRNMAPHVGLELTPQQKDLTDLLKAASVHLNGQIITGKEDELELTGISLCPKCNYAYFV
jgi:hypothetical protein